jgi:transposase
LFHSRGDLAKDGTTALQESAQLLLAGRRKVVDRLEVMAGPTGRRSWPEAVKARIVVESFEPGARVVDVARRHGVAPQQVTAWRRDGAQGQARAAGRGRGALRRAGGGGAAGAAPERRRAAAHDRDRGDGVVVRLAADAPAARVAEIAAALRASR